MTDYARLRALAQDATPGPWRSAITRQFAWVETVPEFDLHRFDIQAETIANVELKDEDAAYIAAVDPPTLIALLDRLEELEGREPEWEYAVVAGQTTLPARFGDLIEAERHARAWSASAEVLRRRKAGPWEPVTGDDGA